MEEIAGTTNHIAWCRCSSAKIITFIDRGKVVYVPVSLQLPTNPVVVVVIVTKAETCN